jgi:hypothetical protein
MYYLPSKYRPLLSKRELWNIFCVWILSSNINFSLTVLEHDGHGGLRLFGISFLAWMKVILIQVFRLLWKAHLTGVNVLVRAAAVGEFNANARDQLDMKTIFISIFVVRLVDVPLQSAWNGQIRYRPLPSWVFFDTVGPIVWVFCPIVLTKLYINFVLKFQRFCAHFMRLLKHSCSNSDSKESGCMPRLQQISVFFS